MASQIIAQIQKAQWHGQLINDDHLAHVTHVGVVAVLEGQPLRLGSGRQKAGKLLTPSFVSGESC